MNDKNKGSSGVITVMASLLLIPLLAFGTVIMEMGRFVSARQALADAQITASMAVLAKYNTYLFDRFGILAVDPGLDEVAEYETHLKYNSDAEGGNSSRLYNLDSNITCESLYNLSEYAVLKRQVLEYSKFAIPYTYISKKLNLNDIFSSFTSKIQNVTNKIKDMTVKSQESVSDLEEAFYAIARAESAAFDAKNYFIMAYSSSSFVPSELYDEYVYDNNNLDGQGVIPAIGSYGFLVKGYSGRYDNYINAIKAKKTFLDTNPNPDPTLAKAEALNFSSYKKSTINYPMEKAAIKKVIAEMEKNGKTDADTIPSSVRVYYKRLVTKTYSYNLSNKTASVNIQFDSGRNNYQTITLKTAIATIDPFYKNSSDINSWTYADLKDFADDNNLSSSYNTYADYYSNSLYNSNWPTQKNNLVKALKNEQTKYYNNLAEKNTAIDNAANDYSTDLGAAYTKLDTYAKALDIAVTALETSKKSFQANVDLEADNSEDLGSNSSEVQQNLQKVIDDFGAKAAAARSAMTEVDALKVAVDKITGSSIQSYSYSENTYSVNYLVGNVTNTANVGMDASKLNDKFSADFSLVETLFKTKVIDADSAKVAEGTEPLDAIKNFTSSADEAFGISKIWESFKQIIKILDPVPKTNNADYCMTLSDYSQQLLPTLVAVDTSYYHTEDEEYVAKLMEASDFNEDKEPEGTDSSSFMSDIEELFGEGGKTSGVYNDADSNKSTGLGKLVVKLAKILKTVVEVLGKIKSLIDKIASTLKNIISQTFNTILINGYITQKFPSRMSSVAEAHTVPVPTDENGISEAVINKEGDTYFNSCCVEYCMFGDPSEKTNQVNTFWILFGIRAVVNCVQILTTSETMSLVSSCNIFAPLMFIALLYMETNIDMNYLVSIGEAVPFWKSNVHMSSKGIANILEVLVDLDTAEVLIAKSGDGKRFHSTGGCHMLKINPNGPVATITMNKQAAVNKGYTQCKVCKPETEGDKENESKGYVPLTYDNYLYILLLMIGNNTKLQHLAELIQLETRYHEMQTQKSTKFLISDASTYIRSNIKASYNTMLPMISLGSSTNSFPEIIGLEYVGY